MKYNNSKKVKERLFFFNLEFRTILPVSRLIRLIPSFPTAIGMISSIELNLTLLAVHAHSGNQACHG